MLSLLLGNVYDEGGDGDNKDFDTIAEFDDDGEYEEVAVGVASGDEYDDGGSDDKDAIKYDGDDVNINKDEEDNDDSVTDNDANESNDDDDDSVRYEDDSAVGDDNKNSAPVDEFDDDGEDEHVANDNEI